MISGGTKIGKAELEAYGKLKGIQDGEALKQFVKEGELQVERMGRSCISNWLSSSDVAAGATPQQIKDACTELLQSRIWDETDVDHYSDKKNTYSYYIPSGPLQPGPLHRPTPVKVDLSGFFKRLLQGEHGGLTFPTHSGPYSKRSESTQVGQVTTLKQLLDHEAGLVLKRHPAKSGPGEGKQFRMPPLNLKLSEKETKNPFSRSLDLQAAAPSPGGMAIVAGNVGITHAFLRRTAYSAAWSAQLERNDAQGMTFGERYLPPLIQNLPQRKNEAEMTLEASLTLPLGGSIDVSEYVPLSDFASASPLGQLLAQTAEKRWGEKVAKIFMESVARPHLENADQADFAEVWKKVTGEYADIFESLWKDGAGKDMPVLPHPIMADSLALIFKHRPSGLIDLIALLAGKKPEEIQEELKEAKLDMKAFGKEATSISSKQVETLLEKTGGLVKKHSISENYLFSPPLKALSLPSDSGELEKAFGSEAYAKWVAGMAEKLAVMSSTTPREINYQRLDSPWALDKKINDVRKKVLGDKADTTLQFGAALKNGFVPDAYGVLTAELASELHSAGEGLFRGATLAAGLEYNSPAVAARLSNPEETAQAFVFRVSLPLTFDVGTALTVKPSWSTVLIKGYNQDLSLTKHVPGLDLKLELTEALYATAGLSYLIQGGDDRLTAPNNLNDAAYGVGSDGNTYAIRAGYNIGTYLFGIGYEFSKTVSLDGAVTVRQANNRAAEVGSIVDMAFSFRLKSEF